MKTTSLEAKTHPGTTATPDAMIEDRIKKATADEFRAEILPLAPCVKLEGSPPKEAITQMNAGGEVKMATAEEVYIYFKERFALFA